MIKDRQTFQALLAIIFYCSLLVSSYLIFGMMGPINIIFGSIGLFVFIVILIWGLP